QPIPRRAAVANAGALAIRNRSNLPCPQATKCNEFGSSHFQIARAQSLHLVFLCKQCATYVCEPQGQPIARSRALVNPQFELCLCNHLPSPEGFCFSDSLLCCTRRGSLYKAGVSIQRRGQ